MNFCGHFGTQKFPIVDNLQQLEGMCAKCLFLQKVVYKINLLNLTLVIMLTTSILPTDLNFNTERNKSKFSFLDTVKANGAFYLTSHSLLITLYPYVHHYQY